MLVACMAHERGGERDVTELSACTLLKLCVGDDVAQALLQRTAVLRRDVIASTAHGRYPDAQRGCPAHELRRQR